MRKFSKKLVVFAVSVMIAVVVAVSAVIMLFGQNELIRASKNLTNYSIWVKISNDYTLDAQQEVEYYNSTGSNLSEICFHLYPRAFNETATFRPYTNLNKASCFPNGESFGDILVEKVSVDGESANFVFDGIDQDILQVNLHSNLERKHKVKICIDYSVSLANCTHRLGYFGDTINLGNWYPVVCAWQNGQWDRSPYYSTGDPFVSECSNYFVSINYPAEFLCHATGEEKESAQNVGTKQTKFSALCVRDFAAVLSKNSQEKTFESAKTKVTYVGSNSDDNVEHNATLAKKAIEYFSKMFGKYPYSSFVAIKSAFLQGGMEYPNLVIISDAISDQEEIDKVIVHEIAHQWWYSAVGSDQIHEAWVDESLAEYSSLLFFEDHPEYNQKYDELVKDATASYLIYVDVISSLNGKINTSMTLSVDKYASEYEYTYMIYVKGVIMFDTLREMCGKNKMIATLKKYYSKFKFKIATGQNLIDCFKKYCHKDLDGFFSGWLSGQSVITSTF